MKFKLIRASSNIVYHGSKKEFDAFDNSFLGKGNGLNWYGVGFHFCDSKDYILDNYAKNGYVYTCEIPGDEFTIDLDARITEQPSSSKLLKIKDDYELEEVEDTDIAIFLIQQLSRKLGHPSVATFTDVETRKHFQSVLSKYGIDVMMWHEKIKIYIVWDLNKIKILDKQQVSKG